MKVIIDRKNCISCGTCWDSCPDVFEQNPDDSFSEIVPGIRIDSDNAEGRPPAEFEDCAAQAATNCCADVIHVESE